MPTQIDQAASSGVKRSWATMSGGLRRADATAGCANRSDAGEEDREDDIGDHDRRHECRQRLAQQELLARIGVVRTGSRLPCWRSPATA